MRLQLCVIALATTALAATAWAQGQPSPANKPAPAIQHVNPATSSSGDDDGLNPLAHEGENSPTGKGPAVQSEPPRIGSATTGSGTRPPEAPGSGAPNAR
jgi:hypothetical protein